MVTTRQFKSFSLVLAVLIAVGLATSTPPSSEAQPDDHFGMLLHPMYWHAHGYNQHQSQTSHYLLDGGDGPMADWFGTSPMLRSAAPESGGHSSSGGVALPLHLPDGHFGGGRLLEYETHLRTLHDTAPPTQPPRLARRSPHAV